MTKLESLASQLDIYINARLVATGVGRDRGMDWYLYFLKKGVTSYFGVTACIEHGQIFCDQEHMNDDTGEDLMASHQVRELFFENSERQKDDNGGSLGDAALKIASDALSELQDEDAFSIYTAEDYLEGAVERLTDLGQDSQAQAVLDAYGHGVSSNGDPVSILISVEEGEQDSDT